MVFPRSGPGRPIRALLAWRGDIWRGVGFDLPADADASLKDWANKRSFICSMLMTRNKKRSRTPFDNLASTSEALASTENPTASTDLSPFVPGVEAVEAVEANPTALRGWFGSARSG